MKLHATILRIINFLRHRSCNKVESLKPYPVLAKPIPLIAFMFNGCVTGVPIVYNLHFQYLKKPELITKYHITSCKLRYTRGSNPFELHIFQYFIGYGLALKCFFLYKSQPNQVYFYAIPAVLEIRLNKHTDRKLDRQTTISKIDY